MKLVGMLDSPFVRRAAISARLLGLPFEHEALSVFRHFDEFKAVNPVVKAPTLVLDDGTVLIDSSLIVDYFDQRVAPERRLMPPSLPERLPVLQLTGLALAAAEKTVQLVYERTLRPQERQHGPWLERVLGQLERAYESMETRIAGTTGWLLGERITQADVTVAVAWRFTQCLRPEHADLARIDAARFPTLAALSRRAEALPAFVAAPLD